MPCQGQCHSCFLLLVTCFDSHSTQAFGTSIKSGSLDESRRGQMNIERTANVRCVRCERTERRAGASQARKQGQGYDLQEQGSRLLDSRIPSRCASIVGVEELWRLHAALKQ